MHSISQHECNENAQNKKSVNAFYATKEQPSRTVVHAKLEMTDPDSTEEVEADAAANDIVQGGKIARSIFAGSAGGGMAVSSQMESRLNALQGSGQQMPHALQSMMERGFGRDFSNVRLHTDSTAADMSASIHAKAFAHGSDIYFNCGQYNPNTIEGQQLVAHELAHVVQGGSKVARTPNLSAKENVDNYKQSLDIYRLFLYAFQKEGIINSESPKEAEIIIKAFIYAHKEDTFFSFIRNLFENFAKENGLGSDDKIKSIAQKIEDAGFFDNNPIQKIVKYVENEVGEEIYELYYDRLERELQEAGKSIPVFDDNENKRDWLRKNTTMGVRDQVFYEEARKVQERYAENEDPISKNKALIAEFKANKVNRPNDYFELPENFVNAKEWTAFFIVYSSIPISFMLSHAAAAAGSVGTAIALNAASSAFSSLISSISKLSSEDLTKEDVIKDVVLAAIFGGVLGCFKLTDGLVDKSRMKTVIRDVIASVATDELMALKDYIISGEYDLAMNIFSTIIHAVFTAIFKYFSFNNSDIFALDDGTLSTLLTGTDSIIDMSVSVSKQDDKKLSTLLDND